jgi:hypothetical protein
MIMKRLLALLSLLTSLSVHAAPASRESVENLLVATKAESMMSSVFAGMDQIMRQSMAQAAQGRSLNAEQQRVLDAMPPKFIAIMREEMSWQKMKPQYVQLYVETFEQEEVDGLLAFYASPTGQALLNKMPVVVQKSMALSQSLMQSALPKMQAAIKEALAEANVSGRK